MLFVRLFDLRLFGFVCFLYLLVSGKGCSLLLWHSLDFSLTVFFFFFFFFFFTFANALASNNSFIVIMRQLSDNS